MMSVPPMKVPSELKTLARMTTSRIRVTRFFHMPLTELTSSVRFSKSLTFGLRTEASTRPANQPAASSGLSEVIGAATNAVRIDSG